MNVTVVEMLLMPRLAFGRADDNVTPNDMIRVLHLEIAEFRSVFLL
jgi:hypothetical protein